MMLIRPPTHPLKTWTQPPPSTDTGTSLSQLWMKDGLTLPTVWRWFLVTATYYNVYVCVFFVSLTSLPFVPPRPLPTQWILYPQGHREVLSPGGAQSFSAIPWVTWWRPPSEGGRARFSEDGAVGCWHRWNQRRERSCIVQWQHLWQTAAVHHGDRSRWGAQRQGLQMFPVRQPWLCKALGASFFSSHFRQCIY